MAERYPIAATPIEEVPLELFNDITQASTQMNEEIVELAGTETAMLRRELNGEDQAPLSLQEKYGTPYNPDKTIRGVGKFGMLLVNPELLGDRLQNDTLAKIEGRDPSYLHVA